MATQQGYDPRYAELGLDLAPDPLEALFPELFNTSGKIDAASTPTDPLGPQLPQPPLASTTEGKIDAASQEPPQFPAYQAASMPAVAAGIASAYNRPKLADALLGGAQGALAANPFSGWGGAVAGAATGAAQALQDRAKFQADLTSKGDPAEPVTRTDFFYQKRDDAGQPVGPMVPVAEKRANMSQQYVQDPITGGWAPDPATKPEILEPEDILAPDERDAATAQLESERNTLSTLDSSVRAYNAIDLEALWNRGEGPISAFTDSVLAPVGAALDFDSAQEHMQNLELLNIATINNILDLADKLTGPKSGQGRGAAEVGGGQRADQFGQPGVFQEHGQRPSAIGWQAGGGAGKGAQGPPGVPVEGPVQQGQTGR